MSDAGARTALARRIAFGDPVFIAVAWGAMLLVCAVAAWLIGDVVVRGLGGLSLSFVTESPSNAGRAGGIAPMVLSTALVMGVCVAVVAPIGLLAAVWLSEIARRGGRLSGAVRLSLDVLAGVPSVVFGLFGFAFFCVALRMGASVLAGGLTLACMVLPLFVRLSEQSLRATPASVRAAAESLALSRVASFRRATLPVAFPGLVTALLLAMVRALSETAALLFTAGYVAKTPSSLLDPGRVLSVHIYDLAMNVPGGDSNAYASALLLIVALLLVSAGALWVAQRGARFRRSL